MRDVATVLVWLGLVALVFCVCGALYDRRLPDEPEVWPGFWGETGDDREPSDDDIYDRVVEGDFDARTEHDWTL